MIRLLRFLFPRTCGRIYCDGWNDRGIHDWKAREAKHRRLHPRAKDGTFAPHVSTHADR